ncbi:hypothetical protein, partial [Priestia megaterium]|uniref:hypothetical protein n=1 Tax=Priestia megaterium TaxID=1404 RepID=UPI001483619C
KPNEIKRSSIEVMEIGNHAFLTTENVEKDLNNIDKFSLKESKYYYKYENDMKKYIKDGKNEVEITIYPQEETGLQKIVINDTIYKKG